MLKNDTLKAARPVYVYVEVPPLACRPPPLFLNHCDVTVTQTISTCLAVQLGTWRAFATAESVTWVQQLNWMVNSWWTHNKTELRLGTLTQSKNLRNLDAELDLLFRIMSQSIPTGYIPPPGNPGEIFFERANPGHPGKFFCLIRCPGAKNDGRIPGGGAKFSQTRRNCSLSLQKNP